MWKKVRAVKYKLRKKAAIPEIKRETVKNQEIQLFYASKMNAYAFARRPPRAPRRRRFSEHEYSTEDVVDDGANDPFVDQDHQQHQEVHEEAEEDGHNFLLEREEQGLLEGSAGYHHQHHHPQNEETEEEEEELVVVAEEEEEELAQPFQREMQNIDYKLIEVWLENPPPEWVTTGRLYQPRGGDVFLFDLSLADPSLPTEKRRKIYRKDGYKWQSLSANRPIGKIGLKKTYWGIELPPSQWGVKGKFHDSRFQKFAYTLDDRFYIVHYTGDETVYVRHARGPPSKPRNITGEQISMGQFLQQTQTFARRVVPRAPVPQRIQSRKVHSFDPNDPKTQVLQSRAFALQEFLNRPGNEFLKYPEQFVRLLTNTLESAVSYWYHPVEKDNQHPQYSTTIGKQSTAQSRRATTQHLHYMARYETPQNEEELNQGPKNDDVEQKIYIPQGQGEAIQLISAGDHEFGESFMPAERNDYEEEYIPVKSHYKDELGHDIYVDADGIEYEFTEEDYVGVPQSKKPRICTKRRSCQQVQRFQDSDPFKQCSPDRLDELYADVPSSAARPFRRNLQKIHHQDVEEWLTNPPEEWLTWGEVYYPKAGDIFLLDTQMYEGPDLDRNPKAIYVPPYRKDGYTWYCNKTNKPVSTFSNLKKSYWFIRNGEWNKQSCDKRFQKHEYTLDERFVVVHYIGDERVFVPLEHGPEQPKKSRRKI